MLSDEMTTGSMTTSDGDKRAYAARSHAWNIEQKRFKEAFPEVRSSPCLPPCAPIATLPSAYYRLHASFSLHSLHHSTCASIIAITKTTLEQALDLFFCPLLTVLYTFSSSASEHGRERPRKARYTTIYHAHYCYVYLSTTANIATAAVISFCGLRTDTSYPSRHWFCIEDWLGCSPSAEGGNAEGTWYASCESWKWCFEWRPKWKWRVDGWLEANGLGKMEMGCPNRTGSDRV